MLSNWAAAKAFARLRWRAVRATLRGGGRDGVIAAIGSIATLALGGVASVAIFVGLRAAAPGTSTWATLVWGCTLLVIVTTGLAVFVGVNNSLDLRVIATEPLTTFQRALGQLVMAAVGPTGIAMLAVGISTIAGVVHSLAAVPLAVSAAASLLIVNMLLARVVMNILGLMVIRWPRAGQLFSGLVGLGFMIGYQVFVNVAPRMPLSTFHSVARTLAWFPGGWTGAALGDAHTGSFGSLLDWGRVALTVVFIAPLGWVFTRTTAAMSTFSPTGRQRVVKSSDRWRRWFGPGNAGAVATRTALTTVRSPRRMIEVLMAYAFGGAAVVVPPLLVDDPRGSATLVTGFSACFVVILAMSNMFGSDGPAIAHEWLSGATTPDMARGKRRIAAAVGLPIALIGPLLVAMLTGAFSILPVNVAMAAGGVLAGSGVAVLQSSWGAFAAPEDANPLGINGSTSMVAFLLWLVAMLGLFVVMMPVLIAVGVALWIGRTGLAVGLALVGIAWSYGLARLCDLVAIHHLQGNQPKLLEQIQRR